MLRYFRTGFPRLVFLFFFALLMLAPVLSQTAVLDQAVKVFPDFLSIRSEFLSALITAPASSAILFKPALRDTSSGTVRISVEQAAAVFYVMFLREQNGTNPYSARGNIIIKRESSTGYLKALKWFLSDDGRSYLLLTPKNEKTLIDYVVGGAVVRSGISVNTLIYYFIMQDFSFLYGALKSSIDWNLVIGTASTPVGNPSIAEIHLQLSSFGTVSASLLPRTKTGLLLRAILDFGTVDDYFASIGKPAAKIIELSEIPFAALVTGSDMREGGSFAKVSPWLPDRGFTTNVIQALLTLNSGSVFFVLVDGSDGKPARKLLALAAPGNPAARKILCFDAESRIALDFTQILNSRPEAHARVFLLPSP